MKQCMPQVKKHRWAGRVFSMLHFPAGVTKTLRMVLKQLEVRALSKKVTANRFFSFFNCGIVCLFSLTFCPVMNVRDLIYPSETSLEGDSQQGHKAYTRSHNAYLFGKMNKKICITHQAFTATNYILSLYPSVM